MGHKKKILGVYSVERILPLLHGKSFNLDGYKIGVTPTLKVFKNGISCVICGRIGNAFVLEQGHNEPQPYLTLYTNWKDSYLKMEDRNALRKLTRDHIVPRALGGTDGQHNMQVMCSNCNSIKGKLIISNNKLKDIVKFWNSSLKKADRKAKIKAYLLQHNIHTDDYKTVSNDGIRSEEEKNQKDSGS